MNDEGEGSGEKKPAGVRLDGSGMDLKKLTEDLAAPSTATSEALKRMHAMMPKPDLSALTGPGSKLAQIAAQIGTQEDLLARMRAPTSLAMDDLYRAPVLPEMPRNPIHETNDRLERIEQQFASMQEVAVQGAQIATSLQAYAADFLSKFEKAAKDTERSARKAVTVSIVAIILTLITAAAPIVYDIWVKQPSEAMAIERDAAALAGFGTTIEALQAELVKLQSAQVESTTAMIDTLRSSDAETLQVLKDIRNLLHAMPKSEAPTSFAWGPWPD